MEMSRKSSIESVADGVLKDASNVSGSVQNLHPDWTVWNQLKSMEKKSMEKKLLWMTLEKKKRAEKKACSMENPVTAWKKIIQFK